MPRKKYKKLVLSSRNPLDNQLKKMGYVEGYTGTWQLKKSRKKDRQSLYKGKRKMYEVML